MILRVGSEPLPVFSTKKNVINGLRLLAALNNLLLLRLSVNKVSAS